MLIDTSQVHPQMANLAADYLCKSVEDVLLNDPHPTSRLIASVEDQSTQWLQDALHRLQTKLMMILVSGAPRQFAKAVPGEGEDEGTRCRALEARARQAEPGSLTLEDHLDMLDCLLLRYLPTARLVTTAQRQAVRQYLAGQMRGGGAEDGPVQELDRLTDGTRARLRELGFLHPIDEARLKVAKASAARLIQDLRGATRSKIQKIVIDAERQRVESGDVRYKGHPLQQALSDAFGELNRDWRRVAVTETAINGADGFLAAAGPGTAVRWVAHPGACQFCERHHGKVFQVVPAHQPHKDLETQVWVGKHVMNVGRGFAKRKRVEGVGLVDRVPEELAVPAIPAHPHCRCLWVVHVELTPEQRARLADRREGHA